MATTAHAAPAAVSSDKGTYTYIAVFSAVLYTVLLIAPVIAGKLIEQFGLTPVQVGTLFSLELGAFSLATVPAYLWLRRMNLRTASYIFTAIVIAGNVVSGFVDDFGLLMIARVVTSLAAGSITVIILTLSGKTANPSRAFGIFVVFQLAMGALILAVFPSLFAGAPVSAIYWTLAGLAVLCLLVVNRIDGEVLRTAAAPVPGHAANRVPVFKAAAGMAAVLLFYIALSGVWSFIAQISAGSGIDLSASSLVLSLATVGGILSALVATALGETPRRKLYLAAGYAGMALSIVLLFGSPALIQFAVAAVIFKFAWTFILPYLLSTLSSLSSGAHLMNTTNLMIGTGFSIGPIVSGALIQSGGGSFTGMLVFALAGVLASCALVLMAQRR
ncbi:major facilitator superfamily MFS_1 [Arthrobacter sp. FB24]|jgi:predicted MFS family arabinose efflux permease|uniref:MFS transporter n=1 Tax=Arthrobacter sp. (strain FB24) TaxID=290399 RepID=UPI0000527641|nr:MFS transporter [Arthrobacter sp. FB24]ABK02421.1 major facilitator superfamily MFS_1 [Arthrobacter sp. FB24]